ncbi:MAG: glycosyltransferase family 2 protein [Oscillospiraceae bacterium]|nr:glycosyltransferase family 2 protein [Oscillospiraceae bacterium]
METLKLVNWIIGILFTACYCYQFLYIPVVWFRKPRPSVGSTPHHFAVLICARNEQAVIGDLLASLRAQTYDPSLLDVFVMADNCTDDTAEIARQGGARVYERCDKTQVGKGFALQALMAHVAEDYPEGFDGYFIFDADNILSPDYVDKMNRTFSDGFDIVTGYRNSKNYGDNWISAGYALWFLRESRYLNQARHVLGTSCAVGGTGFLFSRAVAEDMGTWPYHLLIEDIEFSVDQITHGRRIAFCPDAVLYDEQPTGFIQSWRQRSRWAKGALQVFSRYGGRLVRGMLRGSFACYDMAMATMPAFILAVLGIVSNLTLAVYGAMVGDDLLIAVQSVGQMVFNMYMTAFAVGAIATVTEWRQIRTTPAKKILYAFTFPFFMITYIPITFACVFKKVEWKPIEHKVSAATIQERDPQESLPFKAG